jgi:2'-5' RNA ligase
MNYRPRMVVQLAPLIIHWKEQTEVEERLRHAGFDILNRHHITLRMYEPDARLTEYLASSLKKIANRHSSMTLKILGIGKFEDKGVVYLHIEKTRALKALRADIINLTTCTPWTSVIMDWQWTPHISIAKTKSDIQLEQWKVQTYQSGEVEVEWVEFMDSDKMDQQYRLATQKTPDTFGRTPANERML